MTRGLAGIVFDLGGFSGLVGVGFGWVLDFLGFRSWGALRLCLRLLVDFGV